MYNYKVRAKNLVKKSGTSNPFEIAYYLNIDTTIKTTEYNTRLFG